MNTPLDEFPVSGAPVPISDDPGDQSSIAQGINPQKDLHA
jgi:hypothetical protein